MKLLTDAKVMVPVYTLAGNHDMYSGGVGYYGLLQRIEPASELFLFAQPGLANSSDGHRRIMIAIRSQ